MSTGPVASPARHGSKIETPTGSLIALLIIAVVGFATYANSLPNPFVFDDRPAIEENTHIRQLLPLSTSATAPDQSPVAGRPVVCLSLALNYALGELDVRGYRTFNLTMHVLAALVLFGVVRRTLARGTLAPEFAAAPSALALAAALLWVAHPMQTECVNYVVQRTEILMALFYLSVLYCAIRSLDSPRRLWWYAGAALLSAAGMATKENMVTAPVTVVLYDLVFGAGTAAAILRRRWPLYALLAATWLVLLALNLGGPRSDTVGFATSTDSIEYLMNQCLMIARYFSLSVWPYPLALDYGEPRTIPLVSVLPSALLVLVVLAATGVALRRWPRVGFLGLWVFVILGPTSSFVPIASEVGAERRMYLPLAAIAVLAVLAGRSLLGRFFPGDDDGAPPAWAGVLATVLVTGVFVTMSVRRNAEYRTRTGIWTTAVRAVPQNPRAYYNLGVVYLDEGRAEEAEAALQRALELKPDYLDACYNLGLALSAQGRMDEAVEQFKAALAISADEAPVHNNLANALSALGRKAEAMHHLSEALRIEPDKPEALNNLGIFLGEQGRFDEAIERFRRSLAINDANPTTHMNLANALAMSGDLATARGHVDRASQIRPGWPAPWLSMAQILVSHPDPSVRDPRLAARYAQTAVEMTKSNDPQALAVLAQCYAAAGQFAQAVEALDLAAARAATNPNLAAELRRRADALRGR